MSKVEGTVIALGIAVALAVLAAIATTWADHTAATAAGVLALAVVGAVGYAELVSRRRRGSDQ
jgi:hypothetical protein